MKIEILNYYYFLKTAIEHKSKFVTVSKLQKSFTVEMHALLVHIATEAQKHSINQSRICGRGIGLGLFPSDLLQSQ